jgi:GT2 family glycosyltransferase
MSTPTLSIVVPTVGRSRWLLPLLDQVRQQARAHDEILVVDQSDAPGRQALEDYAQSAGDPRLQVHILEHRSLPRARNIGIARSSGEVVVFFDDDVVLHEGCLEGHRGAYADPTVGGATGRIRERALRPNAPTTTNRVGWSGRIRTNLEGEREVPLETLKGANMSVRRRAIEQLGSGFDEGYAGTALLEDADLSVRLTQRGWRLHFVPGASLEHLHVPVGGVRTGGPDPSWWRFRNTGYFVRRHRGLRGLPPLLVAFGALAGKEAVVTRSPLRALSLMGALWRGWRCGSEP